MSRISSLMQYLFTNATLQHPVQGAERVRVVFVAATVVETQQYNRKQPLPFDQPITCNRALGAAVFCSSKELHFLLHSANCLSNSDSSNDCTAPCFLKSTVSPLRPLPEARKPEKNHFLQVSRKAT